MDAQTIIQKFEKQEIAFDLFGTEVMINATEMAKPFNARLDKFTKADQTNSFIDALLESQKFKEKVISNYPHLGVIGLDISKEQLKEYVIKTKRGQHGGTYMCEELAIVFAMWLNPHFQVWVVQTIQEIIFGRNSQNVKKAIQQMPLIYLKLRRLSKKASKMKKEILGEDFIKSMKRTKDNLELVNAQIKHLAVTASNPTLWDNLEELGIKLNELAKKRDQLSAELERKNISMKNDLQEEEYMDLVAEISNLKSQMIFHSMNIKKNHADFSYN